MGTSFLAQKSHLTSVLEEVENENKTTKVGNFVDTHQTPQTKKDKFTGMQTLKMLESILNKENKTTVNELQYEDKKLKDSIKNESMFLATGGKMNSGYKTFNKGMGKGLTVISDFSQTPKL